MNKAGVPFPDDAACRVAQDHERQPQVPAHRLGRLGRIDRHRHDISAGGPDFAIAVAVVRQLAEAEGSPMAAVEQEYQRASGDERRQALRRSRRVRQLEVRYNRSRHEWFAKRHAIILGDSEAGENQGRQARRYCIVLGRLPSAYRALGRKSQAAYDKGRSSSRRIGQRGAS
jgi:hypothetical protein